MHFFFLMSKAINYFIMACRICLFRCLLHTLVLRRLVGQRSEILLHCVIYTHVLPSSLGSGQRAGSVVSRCAGSIHRNSLQLTGGGRGKRPAPSLYDGTYKRPWTCHQLVTKCPYLFAADFAIIVVTSRTSSSPNTTKNNIYHMYMCVWVCDFVTY